MKDRGDWKNINTNVTVKIDLPTFKILKLTTDFWTHKCFLDLSSSLPLLNIRTDAQKIVLIFIDPFAT